jgi:hypothetical protein
MADKQTFLSEGMDGSVRKLYLEFTVTCTSLSNVIASGYTAFHRRFTGVPKVLGRNTRRAECPILSVIPTSVGASFYVQGWKDGIKPDGALVCECVLEGYLEGSLA